MGRADYYKQGDWNAICAICGTKYKASELRWNNQINDYVCKWDWEPRHPQERLRGVKEDQSVEWTRPDSEPIYAIGDPYVEENPIDPIFPNYVDYGYVYL